MRAAVCRGFGAPLSIEEVSLAGPEAGEVRVRIRACAICHSDLTFIDGGWGGDLPAVYGHEAAGEVIESQAEGLNVGDPVVVTLIRSCGHCPACSGGMRMACGSEQRLDRETPLHDAEGAPLVQGMRTAAFAEEVTVHHSQVAKLSASIPWDAASLLACGVLTGVGAVTNTAAMPAGATAAVIGLGGVGLNCVQGCRIAGASRIVGLDVAAAKLEAGLAFGATDAVDATAEDAAAQVRAICGGRGVDYTFVSVGAARAIDAAQAMLAPGGSLVVVGIPPSGAISHYDPITLAVDSQRIIGSKMGSARIAVDIPWLVSMWQAGRLKLEELVTGRFALDEIDAAIDGVRRGEALRNVVVME